MNALFQKIKNRKARIGILGMGYVGLPLAVELGQAGFQVIGFDIDPERVRRIRESRSYIPDVSSDMIRSLRHQSALDATVDFHRLRSCDAIIICVPTPLRKTKDPDISYIANAAENIRRTLHKGQLIILESTTFPGTTTEFVLPELEKTGLKEGRDFFLAFSPERIDPGNSRFTLRNTPKVVAGVSPVSGDLAEALYQTIVDRVVRVSSTEAAEMVKLLENTFRAVNVGLVNEIALICHRLGLDVWEIIEAAATKPYGFMPFYPGPGLGGHCIPVDPHYLSWKMKALNFAARFIELAGETNSRMPEFVVTRLADELNRRRKALRGSRILLLGVAYKANVSDLRESPALDVMALLLEKGAHVLYHDPYVPRLSLGSRILRRTSLSQGLLRRMDACVITAAHEAYDYPFILRHSPLVFDTRHATRGLSAPCLVRL